MQVETNQSLFDTALCPPCGDPAWVLPPHPPLQFCYPLPYLFPNSASSANVFVKWRLGLRGPRMGTNPKGPLM